jgi:hypothetical protein
MKADLVLVICCLLVSCQKHRGLSEDGGRSMGDGSAPVESGRDDISPNGDGRDDSAGEAAAAARESSGDGSSFSLDGASSTPGNDSSASQGDAAGSTCEAGMKVCATGCVLQSQCCRPTDCQVSHGSGACSQGACRAATCDAKYCVAPDERSCIPVGSSGLCETSSGPMSTSSNYTVQVAEGVMRLQLLSIVKNVIPLRVGFQVAEGAGTPCNVVTYQEMSGMLVEIDSTSPMPITIGRNELQLAGGGAYVIQSGRYWIGIVCDKNVSLDVPDITTLKPIWLVACQRLSGTYYPPHTLVSTDSNVTVVSQSEASLYMISGEAP